MKDDKPKAVQIQERVTKMRRPNDKFSEKVFNRTSEQYRQMIETGDEFEIVEAVIKGKEIVTKYWLEHIDGYTDMTPLREFDKDVLTACISAQEAGFKFATDRIIFHVLSGGKSPYSTITAEMRQKILESIRRLMKTVIRIDMRPICKAVKKYGAKMSKPQLVSSILPCSYFEGVIVNGQETAVIKFLDESPLMTVAKAKGQILTFDVSELNVAGQHNTPMITELKNYILERVHEIIAHNRNMTPTITFADVFGHCGLSDAPRWQIQDARKAVFAVFEHLKSSGVIQSFEKKKTGGAYSAITFSYTT